jgi:AcrR family transcriptional regulator
MKTPRQKQKSSRLNNRRPGKRTENKEKTRRAILRAALNLFEQKGFYRTTTRAICQKAGIAEGTLFNYFRTKEDLALCFFDEELVRLTEWFRHEKRLLKAPLPEKLFAIIHHHLDRIAPYEEFIGAVYLRALNPSSKLSFLSLESHEQSLRYLRFIHQILSEAEDDKEIPRVGEIGAYAFGLFHTAMITYWLQDRSDGKGRTLALLDRCLNLASGVLKRGGWKW